MSELESSATIASNDHIDTPNDIEAPEVVDPEEIYKNKIASLKTCRQIFSNFGIVEKEPPQWVNGDNKNDIIMTFTNPGCRYDIDLRIASEQVDLVFHIIGLSPNVANTPSSLVTSVSELVNISKTLSEMIPPTVKLTVSGDDGNELDYKEAQLNKQADYTTDESPLRQFEAQRAVDPYTGGTVDARPLDKLAS